MIDGHVLLEWAGIQRAWSTRVQRQRAVSISLTGDYGADGGYGETRRLARGNI